jgi:hypothetical protein
MLKAGPAPTLTPRASDEQKPMLQLAALSRGLVHLLGTRHSRHQSREMTSLLCEESILARIQAECGEERVLVRERIPAERNEVEDESLGRDARPFRGRCDRRNGVIGKAAQERGHAAPVPERLALDSCAARCRWSTWSG